MINELVSLGFIEILGFVFKVAISFALVNTIINLIRAEIEFFLEEMIESRFDNNERKHTDQED